MKRIILFTVILLLALSVNLYAQWGTDTSNVLVDSSFAGNAKVDTVSLVTDGAGGAIIAYRDTRAGQSDVFVQKFDFLGNWQWGSMGTQISNLQPSNAMDINVIPDSVGGAAISWIEGDSVLLQRVMPNGTTPWGMNGIILDTLYGSQRSLQMVTGDLSKVILYYKDGDGVGDTLYVQCVDTTAGAVQWKDTVWTGGAAITNFASHGNPDGSSFIAWAVDADSIYINKISDAGAKVWTDSGVAVAAAGASPYDLDIVSDGADGAILVFRNNGGVNLGAQKISSAGAVQWTSGGVLIAPNASGNLKAISDGLGGVIVAWVDFRNSNSDIYAQRLNSADGSKAWGGSDVAVCTEPEDQRAVNITSDGSGDAYIVWADHRSGANGIYSQRLNASGEKQFIDPGGMIVTATSNAYFIENINIIPDGSGNAILAWTHEQDIRAQKLWWNGLLFDGNIYDIEMTDIFGDPGDTLTANIYTEETFLVSDSILSITFGLDALDTIISIIGFDTVGTLMCGMTLDTNFSNPDSILFVAATSIPITGTGTLIKIKMLVDTMSVWGDVDSIMFIDFLFNEGIPVAIIHPGEYLGQFIMFGDVVKNDVVEAQDASEVLKFVVGKTTLDTLQVKVADVSGNGMVMAYDAALILQKEVGYISVFPAGDTLFAGMLAKRAVGGAFSNPEAEIIANMIETEQEIIVPIELKNIQQVLSADMVLKYDNDLVEYTGYTVTDLSKDFLVMADNKEGSLTIAMASSEILENDGEILNLRFKVKKPGAEILFESFVLNEEIFEVAGMMETSNLPKKYALHQNYPNPFNPETTIKFDLPKAALVELKIYNILGQEVRTLLDVQKSAGYHSIKWDSRNSMGVQVSSGIYLYKLKAGDFVITKKMVLLR